MQGSERTAAHPAKLERGLRNNNGCIRKAHVVGELNLVGDVIGYGERIKVLVAQKLFQEIMLAQQKGIDDVLETEELNLELPSDAEDEKLEEAVEVMEDLEDEQEVDDQPVGIEYPDEHVGYAEYAMKEKYIRMKHKYLKLKRHFLNNISKSH